MIITIIIVIVLVAVDHSNASVINKLSSLSSLSSISPIKTLRNALCFTVINCQLLSSYPNIANAEQQQQQQQQYGLKKGRLLVCKQKSNIETSLHQKSKMRWSVPK
jgi:hypothetical protein